MLRETVCDLWDWLKHPRLFIALKTTCPAHWNASRVSSLIYNLGLRTLYSSVCCTLFSFYSNKRKNCIFKPYLDGNEEMLEVKNAFFYFLPLFLCSSILNFVFIDLKFFSICFFHIFFPFNFVILFSIYLCLIFTLFLPSFLLHSSTLFFFTSLIL